MDINSLPIGKFDKLYRTTMYKALAQIWPSFRENMIIPPANFVCGGYTVFMLYVRACVCPSVRNVLFP